MEIFGDEIVIFGGILDQSINESGDERFNFSIFKLNRQDWDETSGHRIRGRFGHSMCSNLSFSYLFGGDSTALFDSFNEVLVYYSQQHKFKVFKCKSSPNPRSFSTSCLNEFGTQMYLFGGLEYEYPQEVGVMMPIQTHLDDTWVLDIVKFTWRKIKCELHPSKRRSHNCVYGGDDTMLMFGGYDNKIFYNDLWSFDFRFETWKPIELRGGLLSRRYFSMTKVSDTIYIFGGFHRSKDYDDALNDLWKITYKSETQTMWNQLSNSLTTHCFTDVIIKTNLYFV